ncbi:MAG TPA: hypothetical protein VGX96_16785 [Candidatus Elarobacter sp.]|nr:hypothetical protein [Candidatus Elarobacter sp.]
MTPSQLLPVIVVALVTVVVNGEFVPVAPPAMLRGGRVVAPADLIARISDRIDANADRTIVARRGERACAAMPAGSDDPPVFAVAPLARCLGAHVSWDASGKTLQLAFDDGPRVVRTLPPFDPLAPQAPPTTIFTPEPAPATPRAIATGSPQPRRTAIPVTPSWPLTSPSP